jgi:hypothetical protein
MPLGQRSSNPTPSHFRNGLCCTVAGGKELIKALESSLTLFITGHGPCVCRGFTTSLYLAGKMCNGRPGPELA